MRSSTADDHPLSSVSRQQQITTLEERIYGKYPKSPSMSEAPHSTLDSLTDKQLQTLSMFHQKILTSDWFNAMLPNKDIEYLVSDPVIVSQYLIGFQWDQALAEKNLKKMCDWRRDFRPAHTKLDSMGVIAKSNLVQMWGQDNYFRPIMYVNLKQWKQIPDPSSEATLINVMRYFAYFNERASERMRKIHPNVTSQIWVFDLKDFSVSISFVRQFAGIMTQLGEHYPERMGKCIVVNAGWAISAVWQFVKPLMAQSTINKVKIIRQGNEDELIKVLKEFADSDQVLSHLKGNVAPPLQSDIQRLEELREQEFNSSY
jgi:hypothetical protein